MKAIYYHADHTEICERCGSPISNITEVIDEETGERHTYGPKCTLALGIVATPRVDPDPRQIAREKHIRLLAIKLEHHDDCPF